MVDKKKGVEIGDTGLHIHGLGTDFIMPGGLMCVEENDEEAPWSFVVGTVEDFEEVVVAFGRRKHKAYIIQLSTALGVIPVLAGIKKYDMKKLAKGKIVAMNAYIKANFVKDTYPSK